MKNQESELLTIGPNSFKKRQIREITVKKITMVEAAIKGGPLMIPLMLLRRKLKPADGDRLKSISSPTETRNTAFRSKKRRRNEANEK